MGNKYNLSHPLDTPLQLLLHTYLLTSPKMPPAPLPPGIWSDPAAQAAGPFLFLQNEIPYAHTVISEEVLDLPDSIRVEDVTVFDAPVFAVPSELLEIEFFDYSVPTQEESSSSFGLLKRDAAPGPDPAADPGNPLPPPPPKLPPLSLTGEQKAFGNRSRTLATISTQHGSSRPPSQLPQTWAAVRN